MERVQPGAAVNVPYSPPKKAERLPGEDRVTYEARDRGLTLKPHVATLRNFIAHRTLEGTDSVDTGAVAALQAVSDILEMFNLLKQASGVEDLERLYSMLQIPASAMPFYKFVENGIEGQRLLSYTEHWDNVRRAAAAEFPDVWNKVFFPARFTPDEQQAAADAKVAAKAAKTQKAK